MLIFFPLIKISVESLGLKIGCWEKEEPNSAVLTIVTMSVCFMDGSLSVEGFDFCFGSRLSVFCSFEIGQRGLIRRAGVPIETHDNGLLKLGRALECFSDFPEGNSARPVHRKTVGACADRWKRNPGYSAFPGNLETTPVTAGQEFLLPVLSPAPDRTNGVDHPSGRKPIAFRDFRVSGLATAERAAFGEQFRACGPVNGPINTAAAQQGGIRRIDDGLDL